MLRTDVFKISLKESFSHFCHFQRRFVKERLEVKVSQSRHHILGWSREESQIKGAQLFEYGG